MKIIKFFKSDLNEIFLMISDARREINELLNDEMKQTLANYAGSVISYFREKNYIFYIVFLSLGALIILFPFFTIWTLSAVGAAFAFIILIKDIKEYNEIKKNDAKKKEEYFAVIKDAVNAQEVVSVPIKFREKYIRKEFVVLKVLQDGVLIKEPKSKMTFVYPWYRMKIDELTRLT